ncbi:MAG: VWA domain-containing protein [Verrucomicrobiota bacterium]
MNAPATQAQKERMVSYWRLIGTCFGQDELSKNFQDQVTEIVRREELPLALLDAEMGIEVLKKRNPALKSHFDEITRVMTPPPETGAETETETETEAATGTGAAADDEAGEAGASFQKQPASAAAEGDVPPPGTARTLVFSKLILNVFGPNVRTPQCSAQQYTQWLKDVAEMEQCFGYAPGALRGAGGGTGAGGMGGGIGPGGGAGGNRELIDDMQLRAELQAMESDIIGRMDLLEVLSQDGLAASLQPTAALAEQLMHLKGKLSGKALVHARALMRRYVEDLAAVLKKQVLSTSTGKIDRSVPPKRVFRNLDIKRTVWKNLPNYNPADGRLYVDALHYRHTASRELNNYMIVVVDQSGSMLSAMTQCAILASIFSTLPRVKVTLIAFDTAVIDLTPWVSDPFEALMRTNLGGGNDGPLAMVEARAHIADARRTTMVWISDFYERRELMPMIRAVKESGVQFLPVASVSGSGYYSMDGWFKDELKKIGCPVLTGNIKKLIVELKKHLCR